MKYTTAQLRLIAHALDVVKRDTQSSKGASMNMFHLGRFSNKTHYIDYNERLKKIKCYKKFNGWNHPQLPQILGKAKITRLPDGSGFCKARIATPSHFSFLRNPHIHTK